jgi:hypothetical protein
MTNAARTKVKVGRGALAQLSFFEFATPTVNRIVGKVGEPTKFV